MGGAVERAEKDQVERVINHNLKERFTAGAVQRAVLLEHGDDPAIEPGQLMVRVLVPAPDEPADYERALAAWQEAHQAGMDEMRRLLSLRLPSARSVLPRLAKAAAARPPIKQPPGARVSLVVTSEWYMSTAVGGGTSTTVVIPEVDKTWYTPDGAWRQLEHRGHPIVGAVGNEQTLRAAESGPPISDQRFPAGDASNGPDLGTLADNPLVLRRQLLTAPPFGSGGWPADYHLFRVIPLLHHQLVGPALDAAMWRVLAGQSGVRFLGTVTDRAGRRGDAVEFTDSQGVERLVLLISPATGTLLGWEDILLRNPGALNIRAFPAVMGYVAFLSDRWTTTLSRPAR